MLGIDISMFGFQALWSPVFLGVMITVVSSYFFIITVFRKRIASSEKVPLRKRIYFILGASLVYLFLGSPIDLLGHLLFSVHMTQMAGVYLVAVPLLLLGMPKWLLRLFIFHKFMRKPWRIFTHPLLALFMFNILFSLYHLPIVFDTIKTNELLHVVAHCVLFFTSLMMWWPLLNPLPEAKILSSMRKMGYLFANGVLLTPACALIIFSHHALYTTYTNPQAWATAMELCVPADLLQSLGLYEPYFFTGITPLEDQQLGGVMMKIMQEIVYGAFIGYVFYHWIREEKVKEIEIKNPYTI